MGVLGQLIAGFLQDQISIILFGGNHPNVGGHYPGAKCQGKIHNPLGALDFERVFLPAGEAVSPQVAAEGGDGETVSGYDCSLFGNVGCGHVFRGHFALHRIELYTVCPQFGAFFHAFLKRQPQPVGYDTDLKMIHTMSPILFRFV